MEVKISKEELEVMFKNKKGFIYLNDPIFDKIFEAVGMEPRKKSGYGWTYCVDSDKYTDESDKVDQDFGIHDYRCSSCGSKVDYFIAGSEVWYCSTLPNFCPKCGSTLNPLADSLYRKGGNSTNGTS